MVEAVADHAADLVLVDVLLDRSDQGDGEADRGAVVQRPLLGLAQVPATDGQVGLLVEPVELQVDVHRAARAVAAAELGHKPSVGGESEAVGVEVDRIDRARLGEIDHREDVLVDRGLAPGEHHHLGFALGGHERVEHGGALLDGDAVAVRTVLTQRAGVGEADRAVQVAAGVDLDDAQAGVLLVLGAQPTVRGTTVLHLGLGPQRPGTGLVEPLHGHVHLRVAVDPGLELPVLRAPLAQEHLVVAGVDLGVDGLLAHRTDGSGELEEHLVAITGRHGRDRRSSPGPGSVSALTNAPAERTRPGPPQRRARASA